VFIAVDPPKLKFEFEFTPRYPEVWLIFPFIPP
jgi:hypothetical protein